MSRVFNPRARKQYPSPEPRGRGFLKKIPRLQKAVNHQSPSLLRGMVSRGIRAWIPGVTNFTYDYVDKKNEIRIFKKEIMYGLLARRIAYTYLCSRYVVVSTVEELKD